MCPAGGWGLGRSSLGGRLGWGAAHIGSCLDLCHKGRLRDLCNDSDSGQMVVWRSISDRTWATCVWPVGSARCRQAGPPGGRASGGGGFPGLDAALGPSRNAPKPTPASQRRLRAQGPPRRRPAGREDQARRSSPGDGKPLLTTRPSGLQGARGCRERGRRGPRGPRTPSRTSSCGPPCPTSPRCSSSSRPRRAGPAPAARAGTGLSARSLDPSRGPSPSPPPTPPATAAPGRGSLPTGPEPGLPSPCPPS